MKTTKQLQVKVTLPAELHSKIVVKCLEEEGEVNLSSYFRKLARKDVK